MAYVQSIQYTAGGAATTHSFTITGVTAGNTLVTAVRYQSIATAALGTTSAADDQDAGNWALIGARFSPDADDQNQCEVFWRTNVSGGDTEVTITCAASCVIHAIVTEEGGELFVDDYAINEVGNNPTSHTSGSVDTTGASRRIIGVIVGDSSFGGASATDGAAERQEVGGWLQLQDKAAATAGSYTTAWSTPSAPDLSSIIIAFAAVGASTGQPMSLRVGAIPGLKSRSIFGRGW